MIQTTFGKLNSDGSKAVYFKDSNTNEKIFGFWYTPNEDNPQNLKPKEAVLSIILNAGYHDLRDFFTAKKERNLIKP